mgnify:CR=1 FL=1
MTRMFTVATTMMVICVSPASGHHSASIFDTTSVVALQGTVTRFSWTNPHVYIYVETQDNTGELVEWEIETDATPILTRSGWTSDSLQPGDLITVRAHPDKRTEANHALLLSIAKSTGETLAGRSYFLREENTELLSGASDMSGVWELGLSAFRGFYAAWANVVFTEKGILSQAEYEILSDSPQAQCIAIPPPASLIAPNLNEITLHENSIVIRNERFNVERTIYTDGRSHPENGELTNQGHSIGWWEGGTLVVDTTLFEIHRSPIIGSGVSSGPHKHVVERYTLSEDGTRILIDFTLEDPEYLAEPFSGRVQWYYAPHFEMMGFGCNLENSRRYTLE